MLAKKIGHSKYQGVGARRAVPLPGDTPQCEHFGKPTVGTIPTIIRSFKSAVTKQINEKLGTPGVAIWQRNYYEHIIRNEESYHDIAAYIADNPAQWEMDELYARGNASLCMNPRLNHFTLPDRQL